MVSENPTCIDLMLTDVPHSFYRTCVLEAGLSGFHLIIVITKEYIIDSDPVMDNTNDPTFKPILKYRNHSSIIPVNDRCKGNVFNFSKVNVTEIEKQSLKLKKASQNHDTLTRVIIENADIFNDVLCNTFNTSIMSSNIPQCLKLVEIIPLYNNGKKAPKENYRPVSILPDFLHIY